MLSNSPLYLCTTNFINKLKIRSPFFFQLYKSKSSVRVAVSDLVPLLSRNGALGSPTHFFIILTSCRNPTFSPVDCVGPLRVRSFVLPHREDHTESCAVSDPSGCRAQLTHPTLENMIVHHIPSLFSLDGVRPHMGGGLAAAPRVPSARHRAPDWTELLPRQAVGGGDARAEDFYTQCTKSLTEAVMSRRSRAHSVHQDSVHRDTVRGPVAWV